MANNRSLGTDSLCSKINLFLFCGLYLQVVVSTCLTVSVLYHIKVTYFKDKYVCNYFIFLQSLKFSKFIFITYYVILSFLSLKQQHMVIFPPIQKSFFSTQKDDISSLGRLLKLDISRK